MSRRRARGRRRAARHGDRARSDGAATILETRRSRRGCGRRGRSELAIVAENEVDPAPRWHRNSRRPPRQLGVVQIQTSPTEPSDSTTTTRGRSTTAEWGPHGVVAVVLCGLPSAVKVRIATPPTRQAQTGPDASRPTGAGIEPPLYRDSVRFSPKHRGFSARPPSSHGALPVPPEVGRVRTCRRPVEAIHPQVAVSLRRGNVPT